MYSIVKKIVFQGTNFQSTSGLNCRAGGTFGICFAVFFDPTLQWAGLVEMCLSPVFTKVLIYYKPGCKNWQTLDFVLLN